jgi:hypothetical protein
MNMSGAADALRKAMKGFGTDEKTLIQVLAPMGPLEIASVKHAFQQGHKRDLLKDVHSETSSYFREGLEAVIRGPLEQDCFTLREALSGMGTKEAMLDEVLLGRTNADINAIKRHYQHMYKRSLESDLKSDLSGKTERLYDMVVAARRTEESAPINPQQIDQNVNDLYKATESQMGTDELQVCAIICMLAVCVSRSPLILTHLISIGLHRPAPCHSRSISTPVPTHSRRVHPQRILGPHGRCSPLHDLPRHRPRKSKHNTPQSSPNFLRERSTNHNILARRGHARSHDGRSRHKRRSSGPTHHHDTLESRSSAPVQSRLQALLQTRLGRQDQGRDKG